MKLHYRKNSLLNMGFKFCLPFLLFLTGCTAGNQNIGSKDTFILASYNLRLPGDKAPNDWESRLPRVRAVIQRNQLDIFGVQEPVHQQLLDLLQDSEFQYVGGGRDDFKEKGEYSCIIYKSSRFRVLDHGTFALGEDSETPGKRAWGAACPRIATWGLFQDLRSERKFVYYNTHLDHVSEESRINGIRQLVKHAEKNSTGLPLIISGDFNAYPNSATYAAASSLLHDSAKVSRTQHQGLVTTFHGYGRIDNRPPIDFIFVSEGITVYSHRTDDVLVDGGYASDHYPVIIELSIN